jgi:hypothetical protein
MNSSEVKAVVDHALASWRTPVVEPGTTLGVPWDAARYAPHIATLRKSLVEPYSQRFVLAETYEQLTGAKKPETTYWVVAVSGDTIVWFDEVAGDFGIAYDAGDGSLPESIGLRGDLVGSFSAR